MSSIYGYSFLSLVLKEQNQFRQLLVLSANFRFLNFLFFTIILKKLGHFNKIEFQSISKNMIISRTTVEARTKVWLLPESHVVIKTSPSVMVL